MNKNNKFDLVLCCIGFVAILSVCIYNFFTKEDKADLVATFVVFMIVGTLGVSLIKDLWRNRK